MMNAIDKTPKMYYNKIEIKHFIIERNFPMTDLKEQLKNDEHQVQMNKLYDEVIQGFLSEINPGQTNSAIANRILVMIRNGLTNEEMAEEIAIPDKYIDWSPWMTDGVHYKLYIVADYYRWREHFKTQGTLVNPYTGKII